MQDSAHIFQQQVQDAIADGLSLNIHGGHSKAFYGYPVSGEPLNTTVHTGIVEYEPTELVLTARAGTSLREIEDELQSNNQMLACEPPHFSDNATFGGMIASGLSGPARPYLASVQDSVLGCTVLNGKGEIVRFGGKVMKNVAGYDASRLMAGSLGCLGVLLDITLKVIPAFAAEMSCVFKVEKHKSTAFINDLRKQGLPVTASCQTANELTIRFSAGVKEISELPGTLKKYYSFIDWYEPDKHGSQQFWLELREQKLSFFQDDNSLWRLSMASDADLKNITSHDNELLSEWGGYLHWLKTDMDEKDIFKHMASINGSASLFRNSKKEIPENIFQPLSPVLQDWHKNLKNAFDPDGLFNSGKMYQDIC